MKRTISLIILLMPFYSYCQQLTLDQLIAILNKDTPEMNDYLTERGWRLYESKKSGSLPRTITWIYENNLKDLVGRLELKNSDSLEWKFVKYYTSTKEYYVNIANKIKSYSMKLMDSEIDDKGIHSFYVGKNYQVGLSTSIIEESYKVHTVYEILVMRIKK